MALRYELSPVWASAAAGCAFMVLGLALVVWRPDDGAFDRIKQYAGPIALLMLLLGFGAIAHRMAIVRLEMTDGRLPRMDAANKSRIQIIGYIDRHRWVVLPYAAVFAGCLIWVQFRRLQDWTLSLAFILLAIPSLGYTWVCFRVGTEFLRIRSLE
jgi:hypothetical protein